MSHNDCLTLFSWKVWISLLIKKVHLVWVIFFSCITHGMHAHTFKNLLLSLPSFCFSRAPSRDSLTRVCSLSRLAISRKTGKTETAMQLSKYSLKDHRVIMFAAYPDHTACVVLNKSTNRMGSFKGVFEYLFTCNLCFQFTDLIPFLRQQMKNFFLWWPRVDL